MRFSNLNQKVTVELKAEEWAHLSAIVKHGINHAEAGAPDVIEAKRLLDEVSVQVTGITFNEGMALVGGEGV